MGPKSLSFRRLISTWCSLADTTPRSRSWHVRHATAATRFSWWLASAWRAEDFGLIAGPAAEGTLFLDVADPRGRAEAAPVVERFRASGFEPEGYTLYAYAAVQVWAQAAEKAGSLELQAMIASLRQHQFDTVLGPIDFDEKGDLAVQNPIW